MRIRSISAALATAALAIGLLVPPAQASAARPGSAAPSPRPHPASLAAIVARLRAAGLRGQALAEELARSSGNAIPATRGAITGFVRGLHGAPLPGACATATGPAGTAVARTGPDGRYVLAGLRPGRYTLSYRDCADPARYLRQFSGGATWPSLATRITVSAGQVRSVAAVNLRPTSPAALLQPSLRRAGTAPSGGTGRIAGVVTGNGHGLGGICVTEWQIHSGFSIGFTKQTTRTGHYSFGHLPRGRYQMQFADNSYPCGHDGNWLQQWYKGITDAFIFPPKAKVIRLRAGQAVSGIDARLKLGGEISGTVKSRSGLALPRICVNVEGRITGGFEGFGTRTGRGGHYALHALFPGRYTVGFSIGCGSSGNYAPQWWRDSATFGHATPVRITGHRIATGINAKLGPGGTITGVVRGTNASGPALRGVCVNASNRDGSIDVFASTKSDGSYRLQGLPTGRFLVQFDPSCSPTSNYLGQARKVSVTAGRTTSGVNAYLQPGAAISGLVTDGHGHPVGGICVAFQGPNFSFGFPVTNPDGTYSADGLAPGTYTVEFSGGCGNSGSYAPQWYKNQTNAASADQVHLTAGATTTGIDATMQPGGTLAGIVTGLTGKRLDNVCVGIASQSNVGIGFAYLTFTINGRYQATNLAPGAYTVDFGCGIDRYAAQWFRSQTALFRADLVSVNPAVVTRISAVLQLGGAISGVVTNRAGHRLSNMCISAVNIRTSATFPNDVTGFTSNGTYRITGLPPGRYRVQFADCSGQAKYAATQSGRVQVARGRTTKGVDAVMTLGGSISGTVIGPLARPLRNICVFAFGPTTQSFGFGQTGRRGVYHLTGLATGRYDVYFQPCGSQNLVEVIKRGIRVTAPHARTGINAAMHPGGTITGTVLGGSPTAKPLSGICVEVFGLTGPSFSLASTGPAGTYTATGLATADYQVFFGDPFCPFGGGFTAQWYNDQPTQATATAVHVTVGTTRSGIGATLVPGGTGTITGTVTGPSNIPVRGECVTALPVHVQVPSLFAAVSPEIAVTDGSGGYSLGYLLPGTYKVRFDTGCGATGLARQWWKNAATRSGATTITVSANGTVSGIDAVLHT